MTTMNGQGSTQQRWKALTRSGRDLRLEDFLSFRLSRLNALIQREVTSTYLAQAALSLPEWRVLAGLNQYSPLETRALTQLNTMDKAAISRSVDSLIDKGLVTRKADPGHAQRRIVSITAAGRKMVKKIMPVAQGHHAALLLALSPQERTVLDTALSKLTLTLMCIDLKKSGQVRVGKRKVRSSASKNSQP
jgi:DNA-binding MarR family transcriptional regulator